MRRWSMSERERGNEGRCENLGIEDCHVIIAQAAYCDQLDIKLVFSM